VKQSAFADAGDMRIGTLPPHLRGLPQKLPGATASMRAPLGTSQPTHPGSHKPVVATARIQRPVPPRQAKAGPPNARGQPWASPQPSRDVLLLSTPPKVMSRPGDPGHPAGFDGPCVSISYEPFQIERTEEALRTWLKTVEAYGGVVGPTPDDMKINACYYMIDDPRGLKWFRDFCPGFKAMGDRRVNGFPFSSESFKLAFLLEFVAA
jgi:hypothetical protein